MYYGSEWGIQGQKSRTEHDYPLRPCINVSDIQDNDIFRHICRLGAVRRTYKALKYGSFENTVIRNEQLIFKRRFEEQSVYIAVNLSDNDFNIGFHTDNGAKLYDVFDGKTVYSVSNNHAEITIPARGTRVLVLTDGSVPQYPEGVAVLSESVSESAAAPASSEPETLTPLPPVGAPGKYRHFKGGQYELICLAKDSETSEELVIYRSLNGDGHIWARPAAIFYQYVDVNGHQVPRFEKIGD